MWIDCDDDNAEVNPGAIEVCDGLDNDCDTQIDEGFDLDNDGYTTCAGDCDDTDAAVNPGATEVSNGIDDDCDGLIDIVVDQVNDAQPTTSFGCGGLGSIFQSFTPSGSPLTEVELRLRVGGGFPVTGYDTTINIREDTPDGIVLGTATTFVPGPQGTGTQLMVNFELPEIAVTPGQTYVIEWITPIEGGVVLTWMGVEDIYPSGTAFGCTGIPIFYNSYYWDFVFTTYTAV